jgi:hypothetical protein
VLAPINAVFLALEKREPAPAIQGWLPGSGYVGSASSIPSMENVSRAITIVSIPGFQGAAVQACVVQTVAQVDEVAFAELKLERNLFVLYIFEFGRGITVESRRHGRIGESDRHRAKDGGELLVQIARLKVAHLD